MKLNILSILIISLFLSSCGKDETQGDDTPVVETSTEISFLSNSKIILPTKQESTTLMATSDVYSKKLSPFDIKAKTQNASSTSESQYLQYASLQARSWTATEIDAIKVTIASAKAKIEALGLNLELPAEIKLVKSSMEEEGGASGYTRSNYIVLKSPPTESLFLHELFHIYSRMNTTKRDQLYATINFEKCNSITLPTAIRDGEITNPDAPFYEHFLTVEINGEQKDVMFIIYSENPYTGGSFFSYLSQKLMVVEGDANNKTPVLINGSPVLKDFSEASNLKALIGNNTNYTLHPEEVLADHFSLLILQTNVPDQSFLDDLELILK
ncbi:hypothetical protein [uncultured Roseivirga sp.]|uniref:hypothetical protein n=1 Tax=uncultured Roseivirga sp. TaxID=543088 RepID=UPI0030D7172B|tara:strand:- start:426 stop:1406 length:981 start_codon:yes stop_codon:yes gene_type:complete